MKYRMADLPKVRIQHARPFRNLGIEYCGPFWVKEKKYRNRTKVKVYVSVFVCMSTKAIHLEVVTEMTTQAFFLAVQRFIARRGIPSDIFSDNGSNFVGAKNDLSELYNILKDENFKNNVQRYTNTKAIQWHFSVPLAPHFGGLWEAAVKSFKNHLRRVVGNELFTYEEFTTLVISIEAILNSRLICSLSSDPNDPITLTPGHFLIGQPLNTIPDHDETSTPKNRLSSWRLITQAKQHFWNRWYLEYLHELQKRQKWIDKGENIKLGAVVLIIDKGLPNMQWSLGKVTELHQGDDNGVCAATVKTANSTFKRSVKMLCPLPINE
ncbi:uncharacterized protein [Prorops nasuta]|uniref:uncharacterized protein n=1 Tax=Prorops nasuta TaxID=863751 RepID=UPI0034CFF803